MAKYGLSQKAIADLDSIWDYTVKTWSDEQAVKYYNNIREAIIGISKHPGHPGRSFEVIKPGLMGYPVGHHIVFYNKRKDGSVWVEKMDYARHF